jgi:hypothetical protein
MVWDNVLQLKKRRWVIFEKRHRYVAHLMAINASQFEANYHQDLLKNKVIPIIFVDIIVIVILHAASERNSGHLIINSSPEWSRSEVTSFPWKCVRGKARKNSETIHPRSGVGQILNRSGDFDASKTERRYLWSILSVNFLNFVQGGWKFRVSQCKFPGEKRNQILWWIFEPVSWMMDDFHINSM